MRDVFSAIGFLKTLLRLVSSKCMWNRLEVLWLIDFVFHFWIPNLHLLRFSTTNSDLASLHVDLGVFWDYTSYEIFFRLVLHNENGDEQHI